MKKLEIKKEQTDSSLTLSLSGKIDTNTAPLLQKVVDEELDGITALTVDLKEVGYVSSAGLRVLLAAVKKLEKADGVMTVTNVSDAVMDIFTITGFDNILTITTMS